MNKAILLTVLLSIPFKASSATVVSDYDNENYMVCDVEISKDGEHLSSHLVTTYNPDGSTFSFAKKPYHFSATAVSKCLMQPFNKEYNRNTLFLEEETGKYVDLCFRMSNGAKEDRDGYAEFMINLRSDKEFYKFNYLNESTPIKLRGNESKVQKVGDYEVRASCENQMLNPFDEIWSKIRSERMIKN